MSFIRVAGLLFITVSLLFSGCECPPKDSGQSAAKIARLTENLLRAKVEIRDGTLEYEKGNILTAAAHFAKAIKLTAPIDDYRTFPDAKSVKAEAYYSYGMVIIDVWVNSGTVKLYDEKGEEVGDKVSPEWAHHHVDMAISLLPVRAEFYFARGYIYLLSSDPDNAVKWFNSAIGRDNGIADFYAYRANAYFDLAEASTDRNVRGPYSRLAQKDCLRAKALDGRNELAFLTIVKLYILNGDLKSAKLVIQEMQDKGIPYKTALDEYNKAQK